MTEKYLMQHVSVDTYKDVAVRTVLEQALHSKLPKGAVVSGSRWFQPDFPDPESHWSFAIVYTESESNEG